MIAPLNISRSDVAREIKLSRAKGITRMQARLELERARNSRPTAQTFLALGQQVAESLTPLKGYDVIGLELGLHKRQAQYVATLALGKVAYQLRQTVGERPLE